MWALSFGVLDAALMASLMTFITTPPAGVGCADGSDGPRRLRVQIARGLPPAVVAHVREEVEEIWRRHHVAIEWVTTEVRLTTVKPDVLVSQGDRPPGGEVGKRRPIAWILFEAGRPTHYIQVSPRAAIALLDRKPTWNGLPTRTPGRVRDAALGRIIGRALAHEIGHYLLGSTGHASTGLMRAALPDEDLVAPGRIKVLLGGREAAALRARPQSTVALGPAMARCR
jgi:hypothetical protein